MIKLGVVLYPVHIHLTDYSTSVHSFLTNNAQETAFNTKGTSENYVVYLSGLLFLYYIPDLDAILSRI